RIERILLAGMHLARHGERIADAAHGLDARAADALQLGIEERDVERRVVDQELAAIDELEELVGDVHETRLVEEVLDREPVHLRRGQVDGALGVEEAVEMAAGGAPAEELEARQ